MRTNSLKDFISLLQQHLDNGATEIDPYINRDDDNYESKMWVFTNAVDTTRLEIGMEEVKDDN